MEAMRQWFMNSSEKAAIDYFIANAGKNDPDSPIEGGVVIFAAGNDGDLFGDVSEYPASYEAVVSVAATADFPPIFGRKNLTKIKPAAMSSTAMSTVSTITTRVFWDWGSSSSSSSSS